MPITSPIRLKAFQWLAEKSLINDRVFTRRELEQGFEFDGQRITLVGPKGIWKPKQMDLPISITTTSDSPYDDAPSEDEGYLNYAYRKGGPKQTDNVMLREMMVQRIPLIYFLSIDPGIYDAYWPVFVEQDIPSEDMVRVAVDEMKYLQSDRVNDSVEDQVRRTYLTSKVRIRLHQKKFRERVLRAYANQCTLCSLRHRELLDASHIIPDSHEKGKPVVQNGLSLCKIHHAAFDSNILGISPDYRIHVREDILHEIDGPMLKHGIQELDRQQIILPVRKADRPDRERLDFRYRLFRTAS